MSGTGWQVKSLGEVAELTSGGTPSRDRTDYFVGSIPWVKSGELNNNIIQNVEERISDEAIKNSSAKLFPKGSLLIALYGATVGRLGILGMDAATNQAVAAIKIKTDLEINYLFWFLFSYRTRLLEDRIGGAQPNISLSILKDIKVPLPPLPIQKQIAEILEKTDQAKQKRKEANKLTEQFLQSAFIEMFGDPVKNPKGWQTQKIGDAIQYSEYGTSNKSNREKNGYPILSMSNITNDGRLDLTKLSYVELKAEEFSKLKLIHGDIIFNRTNSTELIGKTTYWNKDFDAVIASYLVKLRLTTNFNHVWFSYLLNTKYYKNLFAIKCKKAVNQSNISPTLLKEFQMYAPPLILQKQFAELVQKTEALKEKQKASEKELENLFNSLMQKAFKGELEFGDF